jgi:hypothetical protein
MYFDSVVSQERMRMSVYLSAALSMHDSRPCASNQTDLDEVLGKDVEWSEISVPAY